MDDSTLKSLIEGGALLDARSALEHNLEASAQIAQRILERSKAQYDDDHQFCAYCGGTARCGSDVVIHATEECPALIAGRLRYEANQMLIILGAG